MENKAVVLIVDDIASNIQILASILKDTYQLKVSTSGLKAIELAGQEPKPDLILLDVKMPEMDGYEVIKKLKESEETKHIPVIFVTANDTTEDEEKGLLAGAVDYITKPVRSAIVKARVATHITLKVQSDKLLYIALHDKLTGLYNRHYLQEIGDLKFSRASRHKEEFSVIMCDIDFFKNINDTYGHLVGDKVIQEISHLLEANKRYEDFVARYGGEEFVIILEHCNAKSAKEKAEDIRVAIENLKIDNIQVTVSFGVAQISQKHKSFEALLKDADDALYKAKESGRNKVIVFKDEEL